MSGLEPIFAAVQAGITAASAAIAASPILAALGNLLVTTGINYLLTDVFGPSSSAPSIDDAQVNTRIGTGPRWQLGATASVGGRAVFGEYDEDGNFWYIIAHGDAEITNTGSEIYYLDDVEVTLDGSGNVTTDEFTLTDDYERYEGSGTQVTYFQLWTVTPDSGNAYGSLPSDFTTAFTNLPSDFRLAGVAFTIIKCKAVPTEHYYKIMRFRGVFGLGEPNVRIVANFNRMYDPRNGAHDIDDDTTWTASDGNVAIVWAWWRTHEYGRGKSMDTVDWDEVSAAADICDETVVDKNTVNHDRYKCGVAFPDNKPRAECEQDILKAADAFVAYKDGKAYPVVGEYVAPTLTFTAERDILGSLTQVVDDGEQPVDGVVVQYISPDHNYTLQDAAPWQNDTYYDGVSEARYLNVPIPACQDHNQAVRLAKAIGKRAAPSQKAALQCTLKGTLARNVRVIQLELDDEFSGAYEIASPIREEQDGVSTSFGVVPIDSDRWSLLAGEEGDAPVQETDLAIGNTLETVSNTAFSIVERRTATATLAYIKVTFDAPSRSDRAFEFRYAETGSGAWLPFFVDMDETRGYTFQPVDVGETYDLQSRTVSVGRVTSWASEGTIDADADNAPDATSITSVTAKPGHIEFIGTAPSHPNFKGVHIYRNSVGSSFATATKIGGRTDIDPGAAFTVTRGDTSLSDLFTNGDFASDTDWTKQDWTIGSGVATLTPTWSNGFLYQGPTMTGGTTYRFTFEITAHAAHGVYPRISGSTTTYGALKSSAGWHTDTVVAPSSPTLAGFDASGSGAADLSLDNASLVEDTASSEPQGEYDYWIVPVSTSLTEGTEQGPYTRRIP